MANAELCPAAFIDPTGTRPPNNRGIDGKDHSCSSSDAGLSVKVNQNEAEACNGVDGKVLPARLLGIAGLAPIALCVAFAWFSEEWRWTALASGFAYASLIFSFLGGLWWGLASAPGARAPKWVFAASVIPSLLALGLYLPWIFGQPWPGPSLFWLGLAILLSPMVDRQLVEAGIAPDWWMALRVPLSIGLGVGTLLLWPLG